MRVLVTGASGFLGCHTVGQLLDAGQEVQVLVREPGRLDAALGPAGPAGHGRGDVSVVVGDMTDGATVTAAVAGCDAVVHAAAVFSTDPRKWDVMRRTNALGTRRVLEASADAGAQRIVHVSSYVALIQPGQTIVPDGPLSPLSTPYIRSKVQSEAIAREFRDRGAPVLVVNPPGLIGPDDPYCGDSNTVVLDLLKYRYPMWSTGTTVWGDVRDTAATIVAMLGSPAPANAYFGPSHNLPGTAPHQALGRVTGRRMGSLVIPAAIVGPMTWVTNPLQRRLPQGWRLPLSYEGAQMLGANPTVDDSATRADLGVIGRSIDDTMRDTVIWLHETGRISAREAGTALS